MQAPAAQPAAPAPGTVPRAAANSAQVPNQRMTRTMLYQLLLAEIALQRGQPNVAVQAYLELARTTKDPRIAQRATEIAWSARALPAAREASRLWLAADPASPQARQIVVALLINDARLAEAEPIIAQQLAAGADNLGANLLQLNAMLARYPDQAAALSLVQRLAAPYAAVPEAQYAVAQAALNADADQLALEKIRAALVLRPDWEQAAIFQGQVLQRSSTAAALAFFEQYLKTYPKSPDLRLTYARMLVSDKKYREARSEFQSLVREFPDNSDVTVAVGLLSLQLNDYDVAYTQLTRSLDLDYKDPNAVRYYLGQLEEERKRTAEALKWYGSISGGEQYVPARARYAALLAKDGKLDDARKFLHESVRSPQQQVPFTQAEAQLLRDANDYRAAYDVLARAVEENPDSAELLYDQAMTAEKIDRIDVFESNLRKVIRLNPEHAHAYNALGYTLADRNLRLPEAYTLIETALKLAPDDPFIMDSMGWVLYRMGRTADAVALLKRAFALRPDAEIAAHLGEVLWASNQRSEAHNVWNAALKDNPGNETLLATVKKFTP